jgi:GT2 family glycosyltransferase
MRIDVIIATYNRAASLERAVRSVLAAGSAARLDFAVTVADNNSTDATREVVTRLAEESGGRARYLFEPRQGKSYALNAAVTASDGDLVVFTDDDIQASEDWLDEIHREFSNDPSLGMLAGRVLLASEGLQPISCFRHEGRRYFSLPEGAIYVTGNNMAFRREVFDRVGLFDVRFGPGRFFPGGEETELAYRALKAGYRLLYAPNALVYHNHGYRTLEQACRCEYGYGKSGTAYLMKHSLGGDGYAMRLLYWRLLTLPREWRRTRNDSDDALRRRRWYVKGMLVGLCAAPFVMWGDGNR